MRILTIANTIPMHDRSTGWLRFAQILKILAADHEVHLHPFELAWQLQKYGDTSVKRYRSELEEARVHVTNGDWGDMSRLLQGGAPIDVVFFEHYTSARDFIERVRYSQPSATVMVDSIDISYRRLMSKAAISGKAEDQKLAEQVKAAELGVYRHADVVVAISTLDKVLLTEEVGDVYCDVISLIYRTHPLQKGELGANHNLLFIADFEHDANVDAIVHFCRTSLPLVVRDTPDVRVRIVGPSPPAAVTNLAGNNVEVLGFVPDIAAAYEPGTIAIAPMRYGGGLKGKIAEALSRGVPVVTNRFCLEGFGLSDGVGVLVGDDPSAFAAAIIRLFHEPDLYQRLRENGWDHIRDHFSEDVIAGAVRRLMSRRDEIPRKSLALHKRAYQSGRRLFQKHVAWRLAKQGAVRNTK